MMSKGLLAAALPAAARACRSVLLALPVAVLALWAGTAWLALPAAAQAPAAAGPSASAEASPVISIDARLEAGERTASFRMTLSSRIDVQVDTLAQPMRLVLDLPEVNFQASPAQRKANALVRGFRAGLVAPGRSRIVFDLGAPAKAAAIRQMPRADGIIDFEIVFERISQAAFDGEAASAADRRATAALAPLQLAPAQGADRRPLVVIDPGHGGIDPGAVAGNIAEKTLVLTIAHKLKERIEADSAVRVMMTRSDDRFLTLSERVRMAREARADLFVSLHADSLSSGQEVRGATIYTGSERATDAESARLAQKENAADAAGGAETGEVIEGVQDILMDLARRETRAQSGAVAARLVTELSGAVRMHRVPQRAAGFRVLTAPDVPSILVELGFLSSKTDAALMTSAAWQTTAADAIARAVGAHFGVKTMPTRRGASISP